MKSKVAQHLNEIVSLSMLVLMVVALIAGQSNLRTSALDTSAMADRYTTRTDELRRVVDTRLEPLADRLLIDDGNARIELSIDILPSKREAVR